MPDDSLAANWHPPQITMHCGTIQVGSCRGMPCHEAIRQYRQNLSANRKIINMKNLAKVNMSRMTWSTLTRLAALALDICHKSLWQWKNKSVFFFFFFGSHPYFIFYFLVFKKGFSILVRSKYIKNYMRYEVQTYKLFKKDIKTLL